MEPSGKKGIFVGYSETSKAYRIYVLGQRNSEVRRDVTFHEEAAFECSKEVHLDTEMEEGEISPKQVPDPRLFGLDIQRESSMERIESMELEDQLERSLKAPQVKRKHAWCRELLQGAKKHSAPSGTFR